MTNLAGKRVRKNKANARPAGRGEGFGTGNQNHVRQVPS